MKTLNKLNTIKLVLPVLLMGLITACGGGSSDSGGASTPSNRPVSCATTTGDIFTNNCSFAVNVRYFTSSPLPPRTPSEAIVNVAPGGTLNVGPFGGESSLTGVNAFACQAPFVPSQVFQSPMVTCGPPS